MAVHLANLVFMILIWRGLWAFEDLLMSGGAFDGVRAWLSILIGGALLVWLRYYSGAQNMLPVHEGKTLRARAVRLLFLVVVIGGVAMFWRGWFLLGDNIAGEEAGGLKDSLLTIFAGMSGVAVFNLHPSLAAMLLSDGTATDGRG